MVMRVEKAIFWREKVSISRRTKCGSSTHQRTQRAPCRRRRHWGRIQSPAAGEFPHPTSCCSWRPQHRVPGPSSSCRGHISSLTGRRSPAVREIRDLPIRAHLVVLSACETGSGKLFSTGSPVAFDGGQVW